MTVEPRSVELIRALMKVESCAQRSLVTDLPHLSIPRHGDAIDASRAAQEAVNVSVYRAGCLQALRAAVSEAKDLADAQGEAGLCLHLTGIERFLTTLPSGHDLVAGTLRATLQRAVQQVADERERLTAGVAGEGPMTAASHSSAAAPIDVSHQPDSADSTGPGPSGPVVAPATLPPNNRLAWDKVLSEAQRLVRTAPDEFTEAGQWLDTEYGESACRDRRRRMDAGEDTGHVSAQVPGPAEGEESRMWRLCCAEWDMREIDPVDEDESRNLNPSATDRMQWARRWLLLTCLLSDPMATVYATRQTQLATLPWEADGLGRSDANRRGLMRGEEPWRTVLPRAIDIVEARRAAVRRANETARRMHERSQEQRRREQQERERAARLAQEQRPITPAEASERLQALASLPAEQRTHADYYSAGFIVLRLVRAGAFREYPKARNYVLAQDSKPQGPSDWATWSEFSRALREHLGLPSKPFFETFAEDAVIVAELIEESERDTSGARDEGSAGSEAARPDAEAYRPATWFKKGAATWLRKAAAPDRKSKRVRKQTDDGVVVYSVADVSRWRPDLLPDSFKA